VSVVQFHVLLLSQRFSWPWWHGDSMLSSCQEHCHCHRWSDALKSEGKHHSTIRVFLTHYVIIVAACCAPSWILSSFSDLLLLFGHQKGHPA